jgi:8-oxo-dGTP pyrophosphatase MutT (NUDIX family)
VAAGVIAAGGVVWREGGEGHREVLLIHRPRYSDWGFPKGKAAESESEEECALREVEEETGLRCALERELGTVRYMDARGRSKTVRYWAMRPTGGTAAPGDGVDEVRWLPVEEAALLLTHERDREVLAALEPAHGA